MQKGKDEDKSVLLEYKERLRKDYAVSSANSMIAAINYFLKFSGRDECCIKTVSNAEAPVLSGRKGTYKR